MREEKKNEITTQEGAPVFTITEIELNQAIEKVNKTLATVEKGYLTCAPYIAMIADSKAYELQGFVNIYEFADETFGMSRGTVSNLRKVVKYFYTRVKNTYTMDDKYKGFTLRKLLLMAKLTEEQLLLANITADLSEQEIRDIVDALLEKDTTPAIEEKGSSTVELEGDAEESAELEETEPETMVIKLNGLDLAKELKSLNNQIANAVADGVLEFKVIIL